MLMMMVAGAATPSCWCSRDAADVDDDDGNYDSVAVCCRSQRTIDFSTFPYAHNFWHTVNYYAL